MGELRFKMSEWIQTQGPPAYVFWENEDKTIDIYSIHRHGVQIAHLKSKNGDTDWQYAVSRNAKFGKKYPTLFEAIKSILIRDEKYGAWTTYQNLMKSLHKK